MAEFVGTEFVRGRVGQGPSLLGAEFVRGRDVPESSVIVCLCMYLCYVLLKFLFLDSRLSNFWERN